jgi:carbamoylphosphate synthase small subunit
MMDMGISIMGSIMVRYHQIITKYLVGLSLHRVIVRYRKVQINRISVRKQVKFIRYHNRRVILVGYYPRVQ